MEPDNTLKKAERRIKEYENCNENMQLDIKSDELKLIIRALTELYFIKEADALKIIKPGIIEQLQAKQKVIMKLLDRIYVIYNDIIEKNIAKG